MDRRPLRGDKRVDRLRSLLTRSVAVGAVAIGALPAVAPPPPCSIAEIGRLVAGDDGLHVSESATREFLAGDVLLQLNSHTLRSCSDLTDALTEARDRELARLFLIRRTSRMEAVALRPPAVLAAAPTAREWFPKPTPTPVPIQSGEVPDVRGLLEQFLEYGRTLRTSLPLLTTQPWTRRLSDLQRTYEQQRVAAQSVATLEPILAYYRTVVAILAYKEATAAERSTHEMGQKRPQPNAIVPYHSDSEVSTWLERYPFLAPSVVQAPDTTRFVGWGEGNGTWVPDRAVELLVDHALAEGQALAERLSQ
jgi:hypothetical protein